MKLEMKNNQQSPLKDRLKSIAKHPLFGFILVGFGLLLLMVLNQSGVIGISTFRAVGKFAIYFFVALGFMLLLGYAGLASLGTAGFIGLGTYIIGYFTTNAVNGEIFTGQGLPIYLAFIIAFVVALILGTVVGFISLRIEGMYLAIITLGLSQILLEVFKTFTAFTNGSYTLTLVDVSLLGEKLTRYNAYVLLVFMIVIAMVLVFNIIKSPIGRAMLSMKNSSSAAQAMGISLLKYRLLAFVFATVFAVIGGGFYILFWNTTRPEEWTLTLSLNILAAVVVGGSKSIYGVLLGSFVIFGFDDIVLKKIDFFANNGNASMLISGILIILVIIFYPGGLIQMISDLIKWINKKMTILKENRRKGKYGDDSDYPEDKKQFIIQQSQSIGR